MLATLRFDSGGGDEEVTMPQCMFCQRTGEYSFVWGAGRRLSVDHLCKEHREEQKWELVVPMRNTHRLQEVINRVQ